MNSQFQQTMRYSISADGRTLRVETRIESSSLSAPLAFRVSYARRR